MADANGYDEIWRQRRVLEAIGMGRSWLYVAIASGEEKSMPVIRACWISTVWNSSVVPSPAGEGRKNF